jgi:hypothetical protein
MNRQLQIGRVSYSVDALRSMTEEEALKAHENHPIIKPNDVKKAWKAANCLSIPNHLKEQLKGLKPIKREETTEKKKTGKVEKPEKSENKKS